MKNIYDDINELLEDIEFDIEDTLMNEVLEEVKGMEVEHVKTDVFNVYSPNIYTRRGYNGIDDPNNIVGSVNDMELSVENVTQFNDGYGTYNHGLGLADLINDGDRTNGYCYDYPGEFNQPRPFLDNTEYEIETTSRVENALVKGLRTRKYDID